MARPSKIIIKNLITNNVVTTNCHTQEDFNAQYLNATMLHSNDVKMVMVNCPNGFHRNVLKNQNKQIKLKKEVIL